MKTKELIKLLQQEDPSGELHVRIVGSGVPYFCERKPGYWDGVYEYIDENDNYIVSSEGDKVDIRCIDIKDFVDNNINIHDANNWEKIKNMIKTKTTYINKFDNDSVYNNIIRKAKKAYDNYYNIIKSMYDKSLEEMTENAKKGWKWYQNKLVDTIIEKPNLYVYYNWKIFDENGNFVGNSNVYMTEPILKSGLWKKIDNNKIFGYYEWQFIN